VVGSRENATKQIPINEQKKVTVNSETAVRAELKISVSSINTGTWCSVKGGGDPPVRPARPVRFGSRTPQGGLDGVAWCATVHALGHSAGGDRRVRVLSHTSSHPLLQWMEYTGPQHRTSSPSLPCTLITPNSHRPSPHSRTLLHAPTQRNDARVPPSASLWQAANCIRYVLLVLTNAHDSAFQPQCCTQQQQV
jgi:hypothetical protein